MHTDDYLAAGRIAAEVREMVRRKDWTGKTVYEICQTVEGEVMRRGARCAFPVNTSINEIAAHYTAEPDDSLTVSNGDLVKIDLGAQINGYIADTAVTVCYDPKYRALAQASESALANAMSRVKAGMKARDIGKTIEDTIRKAGFKPIINLSGHSLDKYTIHAGKTIPNVWSLDRFSLSENAAYACEPFVTTKDGGGFVRNGSVRNIFAINSRKKTKDADADRMLEYIWDNFNMLPFALRWLTEEFGADRARSLLDHLVERKAVKAYPVLVEIHEQRVAQAEHTFIPTKDGIVITTRAP